MTDAGSRKLEVGSLRSGVRVSKNSKFWVIGSHYLTTEITESTEDTEISMFPLQLPSADSADSVLKIHFFDSLKLEVGGQGIEKPGFVKTAPQFIVEKESLKSM